jgi:ABC-type sugar transport system substrate-binding protein
VKIMKKALIIIIGLIVTVSFATFGCAPKAPVVEETKAEETVATETQAEETVAETAGKLTIGVSQANVEGTFPQAEGLGAKQKAEELGYDVLSLIAQDDPQKQNSQIEDAISKKVAAVTCWPSDTDAIVAAVDALKAAGIPYIALSRMPADLTNVTAAAVVDNFGAATMMCEALNNYKESKGFETLKVIELVGGLGDQNAVERTDGYKAEAERLGFTTLTSIPTEWDADKAYEGLVTALKANPDVQAIYIPSDFLWPAVQKYRR